MYLYYKVNRSHEFPFWPQRWQLAPSLATDRKGRVALRVAATVDHEEGAVSQLQVSVRALR